MNDYKFITHRTIGYRYHEIIQAESLEEARLKYNEMSQNGDLDLSEENCSYSEIIEEFCIEEKEIK